MSRRREQDINFGSDSFLDVIANVVGILVILIVVVGMRVSHAPVVHHAPRLAPTPVVDEDSLLPIVPELAADPPAPDPPRRPATRPSRINPPAVPASPPQPPQELVAAATQAEHELQALKDEALTARKTSNSAAQRLLLLQTQVVSLRQNIEHDATAVQDDDEALRKMQEEIDRTSHDVDVLQEQVADAQHNASPVTTLKHRMTPVARLVESDEIHFRLAGGRVSVVPVDVLALRLQNHLLQHRDAVVKLEHYAGIVGPCDGYRMKYLIERQGNSLVEELKYGRGVVRFGISLCTIEPTPELVDESAEEALRPSSRFAEALQHAGPRTALTFWVYPDSYELHRKLQQAAYDNGFDVAVRPLPEGVMITISQHGSRSMAQ